jgi:hypothetical protein
MDKHDTPFKVPLPAVSSAQKQPRKRKRAAHADPEPAVETVDNPGELLDQAHTRGLDLYVVWLPLILECASGDDAGFWRLEIRPPDSHFEGYE